MSWLVRREHTAHGPPAASLPPQVAFRGRNLFAASSSDSASEVSGGCGGGPQFAMVHRDVQNKM